MMSLGELKLRLSCLYNSASNDTPYYVSPAVYDAITEAINHYVKTGDLLDDGDLLTFTRRDHP